MSNAFEFLRNYVESTTEIDPALATAREDAAEFGLPVPDEVTGQLITTLAAATNSEGSTGAIAITPAAGLVGLYILRGLADGTTLTCIDPETEHQRHAKAIFREAGYSPSRVRFLPSRPLDVMGRLAFDSYQLVFGQVSPMDLRAFIDAAWPLLRPGGVLMLADALLDGTVSDETRKDRDTVAAREADDYVRALDGAHVARLPLGAGLTLVTKKT
ncbi:O-methyltransferase [Corynebacterium efficiens YS-314]|uniref:Putative methyltransferase n=1 Tax=Corynebacterium efficiens (strain DSM 44549 / YS-314 / AJ 12310 / JCM 11189 / NBRC 100395) TaxID=196164 RepID=Q8FQE3_COREF|nr:O-methyltransferase [Corynebacterium efficiens]EEW50052.1 O-methyltransferase [Corynebacterium efficiens YS-314]BAC17986.1 putative methyltransferase [Corynebacterium efficiens YS-314]